MKNKNNKLQEAAKIARASSIGIQLVVSVVIGYFVGAYIDKHFHTAPVFTFIFLLLGIASGMINVFRTLRKIGQ